MDTMQDYNEQKREEERLKRMPCSKWGLSYDDGQLACYVSELDNNTVSFADYLIFPKVSSVRSSFYSQANKDLLWLTHLFPMTQFKNRAKI